MTTIFLEKNDEIYIVKGLTYYFRTQSYRIDIETLGTWEKVTFSCPSESPNFAFFDGLFKPSSNKDCEHVLCNLNNRHYAE